MKRILIFYLGIFAHLLIHTDSATVQDLCSTSQSEEITVEEDVKLYKVTKKAKNSECTLNISPKNAYKILVITAGSPKSKSKLEMKGFYPNPFTYTNNQKIRGAYLSKKEDNFAQLIQHEETTETDYKPVEFTLFFGCDGIINLPDTDSLKLYHPIKSDNSQEMITAPSKCKISIKAKDNKNIALLTNNLNYKTQDANCPKHHLEITTFKDDASATTKVCKPTVTPFTGNEVSVSFASVDEMEKNEYDVYAELFAYNNAVALGEKKVTLKNIVQEYNTNNNSNIQDVIPANGANAHYTIEKPGNQGMITIKKFTGVASETATVKFTGLSNSVVDVKRDYTKKAYLLVDTTPNTISIKVEYAKGKKVPDIQFDAVLLCSQEITLDKAMDFAAFSVPHATDSFQLRQYKPIDNCKVTLKVADGKQMKLTMKELDLKDNADPCNANNDRIVMTNIDGKSTQTFCGIAQWGAENTAKVAKSPSGLTFYLKTIGNENKFDFSVDIGPKTTTKEASEQKFTSMMLFAFVFAILTEFIWF